MAGPGHGINLFAIHPLSLYSINKQQAKPEHAVEDRRDIN
jgi:hypothetical protein